MELLSGWKEIAEHLHLGVRTAQRWERLGLPVRRVSDSPCSPVVAIPDELELWARTRDLKADAAALASNRFLVNRLSELRKTHSRTRRKTRRLLAELTSLADKQKKLLDRICANLSPACTAESGDGDLRKLAWSGSGNPRPQDSPAIYPSTGNEPANW